MYYIGIDPAYRKGGFSVAQLKEQRMTFIRFSHLFEFYDWLKEFRSARVSAFFCIENSDATNYTFRRMGAITAGAMAKVSRNAGKNQAVSGLACLAVKHLFGEERLISLSPAQKGKKVRVEYFLRLLEQEGIGTDLRHRLSQDDVDAGMLSLKCKTLATLQKKWVDQG